MSAPVPPRRQGVGAPGPPWLIPLLWALMGLLVAGGSFVLALLGVVP